MKKILVILTVGFLLTFSSTTQARGWYGRGYCGRGYYGHGYYGRGYCGPRVGFGIAVRPCYHPVWIAPYWGWRFGRRVWFRGYWR